METLELIKTLLDLGLSAILLYMLYTLWQDRKEEQKSHRATIAEKDQVIRSNNAAVLEVVKENTKSNVELRQASVEARKETIENREAIKTLTGMIHDLLVNNNR